MGSSTSSNAEAFVQLETTAVHTGEEVIGMVYLNVSAHVELQQIYIQFKGKESTTWWESVRHRDLDGKTRTRMEKRHGSAKLIDLAFPLANYFQGHIHPGQYSFPFRFVVPHNLPGSFYFKSGGNHASIIYRVKFVMKDQNGKVKHSCPVKIKPIFDGRIQQTTICKTADIITWCCCKKGQSKIEATFTKNAYQPFEPCQVNYKVDNSQCEIDVANVQLVMQRRVRMKDNWGRAHIFTTNMAVQKAEGYKAKQVPLNDEWRGLVLQMTPESQKEIQETQSTVSNQIECVYMLKIESEMDGSCLCCGAAPALEIPVVYYSDAPAQPPLPPINYEWNPTVFDPLVYRLDENNSVVPSAPPVEI